jgi:tetratricopeptide (TPR) repeat protein
MSNNRREQIKTNLDTHDTEYLLEIWQNGNVDVWDREVFDIIKEILLERLGYVPPQSVETQVSIILDRAQDYRESKELDKALSECEAAIHISPNSAIAYNYLGIIHDEMGQLENAIINYQKAIQIDPEYQDAWDNMLGVEAELEEIFQESISKQHLDNALELANNDEFEKALAECETAKPLMPNIAIAYNYLGMIFQTVDQLEPAIDSYLKAIHLNPHFYDARENLANARVRLEEEQYFKFSDLRPIEDQEIISKFDESEFQESIEPIPQWLYMNKSAFFLGGWVGHRTRYGRSGYDPLDSDFELAHMEGVIIRLLLIRKFRTRNPLYLLFMLFVGVLFFLYGAVPFTIGNLYGIILGVTSSPYLVVGALLLVNVFLSLFIKSDEYKDSGNTFF